jgi:hypothetical protein
VSDKLCLYCSQPLGAEASPDDAPEGHAACWRRRPDVVALIGPPDESTSSPPAPPAPSPTSNGAGGGGRGLNGGRQKKNR